MIGEVDIYGVFLPTLLVCAILSLAVVWILRRILAGLGVYRAVWHPALFDVALYILCLGGVVALTAGLPQ